jgi:biotin-(acetyl-CoA carboxylase) ligase
LLKWPNDLLLNGAKLAGVLAQAQLGAPAVVVGIGINVGWAPEGAAMLGDARRPRRVAGCAAAGVRRTTVRRLAAVSSAPRRRSAVT